MICCYRLYQSSKCIVSIDFCLINFVCIFLWIVIDLRFLCDIRVLIIAVLIRFHHFSCLKVCVSHLFHTVQAVIGVDFDHCCLTDLCSL